MRILRVYSNFCFRLQNNENIIWDCIEVIMFKILFNIIVHSKCSTILAVSQPRVYLCLLHFFYCLSKLKAKKNIQYTYVPIHYILIHNNIYFWCWNWKYDMVAAVGIYVEWCFVYAFLKCIQIKSLASNINKLDLKLSFYVQKRIQAGNIIFSWGLSCVRMVFNILNCTYVFTLYTRYDMCATRV